MENKIGVFKIVNDCNFELISTHNIVEDAVEEINSSFFNDGMYFIMPVFIKNDEEKRQKKIDSFIETANKLGEILKRDRGNKPVIVPKAISLKSIREYLKQSQIKPQPNDNQSA